VDDRAAEDQRVVQAVLHGEREAFGELVGRYQRMIAAVAWRYGTERNEVEDVVSEVFLKVYCNLHRYRPEHAFATWLYRLAANHVLDHGRRARRAPARAEIPDGLADPAPRPEERAERRERACAVRRALTEVTPRYREALFLVYVEGLKVEETARLLGLPTGTVKTRLLRGRAALRRILARREPGLGGGRDALP
jgi:RNA polymerase sigma-70 factor (ECF subfamily)